MFILGSTSGRDILRPETFETEQQAWETMRDALLATDPYFKVRYEKDADKDGFVTNSKEYGITKTSAWGNVNAGEIFCDWRIFDVKELKP